MTPEIRDYTADDAGWIIDMLAEWDPTIPRDYWRRAVTGEVGSTDLFRVATVGGRPVGSVVIMRFEGMPRPFVSINVLPEYQAQGVGSALHRHLREHLPPGEVTSGMPDSDQRALDVVRHWGFEVLGHGIDSVLALSGAEPAPELPAGVRIVVRPAAMTTGDDLDIDGFLSEVGDYPEAADYGNSLSNAVVMEMAPNAVWLLLADDQGILAAVALDPRDSDEWYVLFTASSPRARGRGLARAAKGAAHRYAVEGGARSIRTTNEERNTRIRALNDALGYRAVSGDIRLVRRPKVSEG